MAQKHTNEPVAPRIRYYIYGIIRENSTESIRIPSSYELAKMFGTSRRIVQYELERLIGEGVLIGRERIGTFTNPLSSYSFNVARDKMKLVGVTYGSGDHFTYAHEGAYSIGALYAELVRHDCYVHDLRLAKKSAESMLRDITSLKLDGLIWSFPRLGYANELFGELVAAGIRPVTCGNEFYPGVSGVKVSCEAACRELHRRFRTEKYERILFLLQPENPFRRTLKEVFGDFQLLDDSAYDERRMPDILDSIFKDQGMPDVIFCHSEIAAALSDALHGKKCRIVALREFSHSAGFRGIILHPPYEKLAQSAVTMIASPGEIRQEICECTLTEQ